MMRDRHLLPHDQSATDGVVMYETNFGFHRQPFQCADLARAFFVSESIRNILPQILHTLRSDLGIGVLTGPSGVGKTALLKHIQSILTREGRAVICSGAGLETPHEVLQTLQAASLLRAGESTSDSYAVPSVGSRWTVLEQMRKTTEFWGPVLLLIDDAQLLSVPVLNELRAFTEEEWNGRSLVRCLIAGPLSLEELLARPEHADFSRRIRCHAFLQPLRSQESIEFLRRYIEIVGGRLGNIFSSQGLELIASASDGLPRCLSLLADESLIVAAERSLKTADEDCVRTALTRMQHLPYAWNVSPRQSKFSDVDPDVDHEPHTVSDTLPMGSSRSELVREEIAVAAPGVIEIGAVAPRSNVSGKTPSKTSAHVGVFEIGPTVPPVLPVAAVSVTAPVAAAPEPEVRSTSGVPAFEVGHRYWPDAIESTDAVEMDEFTESDTARGELDHMAPSSFETSSKDLEMGTQKFEAWESPSADRVSGWTDSSVEDVDVVADRAPDLVDSGSSHEPRFFVANATEGLANRLPVFDRYTWIALGREVPSGTYAVSSASEMKRVSESGFSESWPVSGDSLNLSSSLSFDRIPIHSSSDAEIQAALSEFADIVDEGRFLPLPTASSLPGSVLTSSLPDRVVTAIARTESDLEVVGVEQFNPAEMFASFTNNVGSEPRQYENQAIISDDNRRVIENAIRSALMNASSAKSQADATDSTGAARLASGDEKDFTDNLAKTTADLTESIIHRWNDGQLLFKRNIQEDVPGSDGPANADDAGMEPEQVSFNFEAARLARDVASHQTQDPARSEGYHDGYFTLPETVPTIEWDLRGGLLHSDDVSPLADSVASLRDEVTSFQESGWRSQTDSAETRPEHGGIDSSAADSNADDSLVAMARRRLAAADMPSERFESVVAGVSDSFVAVQTAMLQESSVVQPMVSSGRPSATSAGLEADLTNTPAATGSIGFSRLFTRLRQSRHHSAEKR